MDKILIVSIAIAIFTLVNILYYKLLSGYVKKTAGQRMWKTSVSKLYFWQSALYTSTAVTVLVVFLLK